MSTYFVGHKTINAAATLILMAEGPRSVEEITKIGKSLWMMNALAVEARYASENAQDYLDTINGYSFDFVEGASFVTILKAAKCFLYQCSEGHVPEMSLFKKIDSIAAQYASVEASAEYEAAPWDLCG